MCGWVIELVVRSKRLLESIQTTCDLKAPYEATEMPMCIRLSLNLLIIVITYYTGSLIASKQTEAISSFIARTIEHMAC